MKSNFYNRLGRSSRRAVLNCLLKAYVPAFVTMSEHWSRSWAPLILGFWLLPCSEILPEWKSASSAMHLCIFFITIPTKSMCVKFGRTWQATRQGWRNLDSKVPPLEDERTRPIHSLLCPISYMSLQQLNLYVMLQRRVLWWSKICNILRLTS